MKGPPPGMKMPRPTGGTKGPPPNMYGKGTMYGGMVTGPGGRMRPPQSFGPSFVPSRAPGEGGEGSDRDGAPAESTSQFKDTARLVELSVYGIASLYDPLKSAKLDEEKKDEKKEDEK
jgi:hypothetical protein